MFFKDAQTTKAVYINSETVLWTTVRLNIIKMYEKLKMHSTLKILTILLLIKLYYQHFILHTCIHKQEIWGGK